MSPSYVSLDAQNTLNLEVTEDRGAEGEVKRAIETLKKPKHLHPSM